MSTRRSAGGSEPLYAVASHVATSGRIVVDVDLDREVHDVAEAEVLEVGARSTW
jgi:hypothetical protein